MESLEAAVNATCPLAFSGFGGALFLKTVTALVAAHCSIVDNIWPKDYSGDIINGKAQSSYDFIIIGAGTAGSLLAGRLAQAFPSWSILLVEAGGDPGLESEIPGFLILNQHTECDWLYKTNPDGASCLSFRGESCIWSQGRGLGGSSAINGMLYVTGHPQDYDHWKKLGNFHWGYDDLRPYFEGIKDELHLNNYVYHENPWYPVLESAWNEVGITPHNKDVDDALIGTKITKLITMNGRRLNTAKHFLQGHKNLHIMKNTVVQKLLIDPASKIVTGIKIKHGTGTIVNLKAIKEVILSAGSIATPKILMLSGIGRKSHLKEHDIDCILDLPVGKNLQDHVLLPLLYQTNENVELPPESITKFFLQYMLTKTGPLTNIGLTDFMSFIDTKNDTKYPEIQFFHAYFPKNDNYMLKSYFSGIGYKDEIVTLIQKFNRNRDILGISPCLLHPKSRGEILLASKDPDVKPVIKASYFSDHNDIKTIIKAIDFIHQLEKSETFKALDIKLVDLKVPNCFNYEFDTEPYWDCYIRNMATTIFHPVGTVKMGKINNGGVVNEDLMIHGMKNLRVVDASVMPTITGGNTMAPTLVIADKAADIIKMHYVKDEL